MHLSLGKINQVTRTQSGRAARLRRWRRTGPYVITAAGGGNVRLGRATPAIGLALFALAAAAQERRPWFRPTAWERTPEAERPHVHRFAAEYMDFLGRAKTEREVVAYALEKAKAAGFQPWSEGRRVAPGDRLAFSASGKIVALVVAGERPVREGLRVVAAHIDAVRIDLKPNPIYEDANLVLFQTQYYGGITYSQWQSRPLALHGVVIRKDGTRVDVRLGSEPGDPVLVIPDVLVHLRHRVRTEAGDRLPAEKLDPVVASIPDGPGGKGRFRAGFLRLLGARYGVEERDLRTAELSLVPADAPRSVGLDEGLVGGYGQDDRACAYVALRSLLDLPGTPRHTAMVLLVDKEEVGSTGNTGMDSDFFRRAAGTLLEAQEGSFNEQRLRETLVRSRALSADVTSAADPHFKKLYERHNVAYLGSGPVFAISRAHAELLHGVRSVLERNRIPHQVGLFSRVFGGTDFATILPFLARHGLGAVEVGIPLLSMHAPFELVSKVDLYWSWKAYQAFLRE
jgi:aspartyl aminopeptidase